MTDPVSPTLDRSRPPSDFSLPLQALWWLKKGGFRVGPEWEEAHNICVSGEGHQPFDWIHALCHWIEADFGNSDYWYRVAGEKRHAASVSGEWAFLVTHFAGGDDAEAPE